MSKDTLRKFSYQNQYSLNEHRFDLVSLPSIYSKNVRAPNIVADYSRQVASRGGFDSSLKKDKLPDRSYTVNYNQVQKKSQQFSFKTKKHSEVAKALPREEIEERKETMMERLLRKAQEEKDAIAREMARRKKEIDEENKNLAALKGL